MTTKEKAPGSAATLTGAGQEKQQGVAAIPCVHFTKNEAGRQPGFIESLLLYGAENGQTISDLERLTGQRSREIRKQIEQERRAGALIISDNAHGYYLTNDPAEAQRFTQSMLHRSREIARTARAVEKAAGLL